MSTRADKGAKRRGAQQQSDVDEEELLDRIGRLARSLHESLKGLGLDQHVEHAAEAIPDVCDRLHYISSAMENAANRSLNAIEAAQPLQDRLGQQAKLLDERWQQWFDAPLDSEQAKHLVNDTRRYLGNVPADTDATSQRLLEVVMAQEFQDLSGQMVMRMVESMRTLESELIQVLLDYMPERSGDTKPSPKEEDLEGPQLNPTRRDDVASNQSQVDDLLDSLGF